MTAFDSNLHGPERGTVKRRRVYYLSGFDPRGAAHYHRLYRDEAAKQAHMLGVQIVTGSRRRRHHSASWQVASRWGRHEVTTDYIFLGWDDVVREHWRGSHLCLVVQSFIGLAAFVRQGFFHGLRRANRGPFLSATFPFASVILLAIAAVLLGGLAAQLAWYAGFRGWHAIGGAVLTSLVLLWAGMSWFDRIGVLWLLRIYRFAHRWGCRSLPTLDARMDEMAARIAKECRQYPADEILVVGHSVGTMVLVGVVARLLRAAPEGIPNLKLVTLGGCIPLLSRLRSAQAFRCDLRTVGHSCVYPWVDVAAQADPLCFARMHPLAACGIALPHRPRQVIAKFFKLFSPTRYRALQRDKMRLHFQYLMAADLPGEYDYFRLTAGPDPLQT
ncbi:hypothetical protein [Pandoraea sp. NPDC087047]|uniref:hypothetical protein n=1 Tax=Pandoraea sp. NPDC087047 TaxID=3364390 RepID=UPI0037FD290D